MRPVRVSLTGIGSTVPVPLDINIGPFAVGMGITFSVEPTGWRVEHTFDDIWADDFNAATAEWFEHPTMNSDAGAEISLDGNYAFPSMACRLTVDDGTATADFTVIQSSGGIS